MKKFKLYQLIIYTLLTSVLYSQSDYYFYYSLNQGANLLSFPIVNDNNKPKNVKIIIIPSA